MNPDQVLELLTPNQVAKKFQLSVRTVRFHALTGELPAVKIGRAWRFRQADLERCIARRLLVKRDISKLRIGG